MREPTTPHGKYAMSIIAVEDDLVTANSLKKIIQDRNCYIDIFNTGEELLKQNISDYDLVLLDLELPGIDGLSVADCIRQNSSIPIIILSAHQGNDMLNRTRTLGVNGFLAKPLSPGKCNLLLDAFKCKHTKS